MKRNRSIVLKSAIALLFLALPVTAAKSDQRPVTMSEARVLLVQNSSCENWYYQIQQRINSYNYQCSGELSESWYAWCQSERDSLNSEISYFQHQCG